MQSGHDFDETRVGDGLREFRIGIEEAQGQEVDAITLGNPDLQPDEGETRLLGVACEPGWATGLGFSVDLWEIEHEDRVLYVSVGPEVFDFFLNALPPDQNPYVIRAPQSPEDIALGIPGRVIRLVSTYVNAGKITTRGVDVGATYPWSAGRAVPLCRELLFAAQPRTR